MQTKTMTRSLLLAWAGFAACALNGGQPAPGVAGVDVLVKQNPGVRTVTDARGNFTLSAIPPGSYTLTFRAPKAKDTKALGNQVTVADFYEIKIEGTKRSVKESGFSSSKLIAGIDIPVAVGSGAKVRGQVAATDVKKMVWIPKEPGSNIPGRWVAADSAEAKAAFHHQAVGMSGDGLRRIMEASNDDPGTAGRDSNAQSGR